MEEDRGGTAQAVNPIQQAARARDRRAMTTPDRDAAVALRAFITRCPSDPATQAVNAMAKAWPGTKDALVVVVTEVQQSPASQSRTPRP